MNKIKCICLIRVSTTHQELNDQRNAVVKAAKMNYKANEIAIVEGKESAIKLKEEERQTLNEMKEIIAENPSVESVYVYAIDRLARRVSVIMSVKEYLTERGINLVFLNPRPMATLIKDNTTGRMIEDELTNILLMLLSYGAEMEMKIKKARFETAKESLKKQGKIASGVALYGYYRDENGNAQVNENEARIIRDLFNIYLNENISLMGLFKKMVANGDWDKNVKTSAMGTRVRNILTNLAYSGGTPTQRTKGKKGEIRTEKYPAIVSKEIQDAVIAKLQGQKKAEKTTSKNIYYGKGIVKYQMENGKEFAMAPVRRNVNYAIMNDDVRAGVNINVVDSILWDEAVTLHRFNMNVDKETTRKTYINTIEENKVKIANLQPKLDEIRKRQTQAFQMLMKGKVSEEVYDETMKEIGEDENTYSKEIARLETANANMEMMIGEISDAQIFESNLAQIDDDEERAKIIRQVIEKMVIKKAEAIDQRTHKYIIQIVPKDVLLPFYHQHTFEYWVSGGVFHLDINYNGIKTDQTRIIKRRIKQYDRK